MLMKNPSRPGDMIGRLLRELGVSVTDAAGKLGVSRQALSNLINKPNASVSPEMALRLEAVLGSTAGNWLRMQANYDEAMIREQGRNILKELSRSRLGQSRPSGRGFEQSA